jgi:hypothetical protein
MFFLAIRIFGGQRVRPLLLDGWGEGDGTSLLGAGPGGKWRVKNDGRPVSEGGHYKSDALRWECCRDGAQQCCALTKRLSEVEVAVDAPEAADGVVKDTVVRRGEVLLDVAWIVVVGDVDDFEAAEKLDAMTAEGEIKTILEFQVEVGESREAAGFIACTEVVPVLVEL